MDNAFFITTLMVERSTITEISNCSIVCWLWVSFTGKFSITFYIEYHIQERYFVFFINFFACEFQIGMQILFSWSNLLGLFFTVLNMSSSFLSNSFRSLVLLSGGKISNNFQTKTTSSFFVLFSNYVLTFYVILVLIFWHLLFRKHFM